jgi:4'-phosphopantetheinyl transferase
MLWQIPPVKVPSLATHTIHVWRANLDHYSDPPILSLDEKNRAERFKFPIHQNRFTAARTILRRILSQYLNQSPSSLQFSYTQYGKPYLANTPLYFNVSHAGQWAVYAISLQEKTGIDIEHISIDREIAGIAERFFSDYENEKLQQIAADKKIAAFFQIWTCKEAFIKAVGQGLSFPLKNFDVDVLGESLRLASINKDLAEARLWSVSRLAAAENYATTLVVRSMLEKIELWQWVNGGMPGSV